MYDAKFSNLNVLCTYDAKLPKHGVYFCVCSNSSEHFKHYVNRWQAYRVKEIVRRCLEHHYKPLATYFTPLEAGIISSYSD